MNSKERLEQILLHLRLSANKFSKEIGHSSNVRIHHVKSGRNEISEELAKEIIKRFPEFNYSWLVSDTGKMLLSNEVLQEETFENLTVEEKLNYLHEENIKMMVAQEINRIYLKAIIVHLSIDEDISDEINKLESKLYKMSSN